MATVDERTLAEPRGRSRWAADPEQATRRHPAEDQGRRLTWRGPFERDRDRLLHARAFRRLAGKTQLLAVGEGRQVRTRLTHTLEISAAARTLARHLNLNEDLAEAIALAHELGQPPFGNAGARALHDLLSRGPARLKPANPPARTRGSARESKALAVASQGFDASTQALRVIDLLEVRYAHAGLNLTDATREGLFKLRAGSDVEVPAGIDPAGLRPGEPPPLEAECVRAAWLAMTPLHDIEDMISEGFLELLDVLRVDDAARVVARLKKAGGWPRGKFRERAALHRALVHAAITDVLVASQKRLVLADDAGRLPKGAEW
ncbi:MAG: HD domain-containing protein [Acidobacteriota bacterium]